MPKAKSPSSGKTSRATTKDQAATPSPVVPDGNPVTANVTATAAAPAKEVQPKEVQAEAVKVEAPAETKKFELHKNEARSNETRNKVVPINVEDEIRRRAYELSQQRTYGAGNPAEDWLAAEREVMQRYRQQRA
jgi:hypothetical protein